jgi:hypothetical protein
MKDTSTLKSVLRVLKKRLNLRTLFVLVILLAANSYAWFIYSTKVAGGVTAKVKAWNVLFQVGDQEVTQDINFNLDDIYPGMSDYVDTVTVSNRGDTQASFSYEINYANILGTTYTKSATMTSSDIQTTLATSFPFKITVGTSSGSLEPNSTATFTIGCVWPYESGDDTTDTYWGNQAYNFRVNNPDTPSISINITITAVQTQN